VPALLRGLLFPIWFYLPVLLKSIADADFD
jgi:hypothetical protein